MCAIPEEIGETLKNLENLSEVNYGDLKIFSGEWTMNKDDFLKIYVSVAWSGWGKVSAARTATRITTPRRSRRRRTPTTPTTFLCISFFWAPWGPGYINSRSPYGL